MNVRMGGLVKQQLKWLMVGTFALITACSGNGGSLGDSHTYSAKIMNWPSPKTGSVRLNVGDSVTGFKGAAVAVDANGNFSNLVFPGKALVASALSVSNNQNCTTGSVTYTPNTVKIGSGVIQVLNATSQVAGTISEATRDPAAINSEPAVGDKVAFRFFADGNLTISGTCATGNPASSTTYDVNMSAGWNLVIGEVTGVTGKTTTSAKFTSSALPADAKLYYSVGANPLLGGVFNP
jgi:hypothetical protein